MRPHRVAVAHFPQAEEEPYLDVVGTRRKVIRHGHLERRLVDPVHRAADALEPGGQVVDQVGVAYVDYQCRSWRPDGRKGSAYYTVSSPSRPCQWWRRRFAPVDAGSSTATKASRRRTGYLTKWKAPGAYRALSLRPPETKGVIRNGLRLPRTGEDP